MRSRRIRSSESEPGRTRPIGPRDVDPPPKNASNTSPRPPKPAKPLARTAGAVHRVAAEVDDAPLLRVGQHLVSDTDLLEQVLCLLVGVDVGMQPRGRASDSAFDFGFGCVLLTPSKPQ